LSADAPGDFFLLSIFVLLFVTGDSWGVPVTVITGALALACVRNVDL
jgi:hypothetical protein